MNSRLLSLRVVALVASLALAAGAALARPAAAEEPVKAQDPVVVEVVRLLDADLGEPLVRRWLAESGRAPGKLSTDDLVALKRAGASDELVGALLDLANAGAREEAPAVGAAPRPEASARVEDAGAAQQVPVSASLTYVHQPEEGEAWNLVVYLDGVPFPPLAAAPSTKHAQAWRSERRVAPGPHVLRWAQERHRDRREEQGLHAARFDPEALQFELAPGAPATIDFEYRDRTGMFLRMGSPVTARVTQGGREIAVLRSGGDAAAWSLLCEDYEANLAGRKPSFSDRVTLRQCVRWSELWAGVATVPGRDQVRPPVE